MLLEMARFAGKVVQVAPFCEFLLQDPPNDALLDKCVLLRTMRHSFLAGWFTPPFATLVLGPDGTFSPLPGIHLCKGKYSRLGP